MTGFHDFLLVGKKEQNVLKTKHEEEKKLHLPPVDSEQQQKTEER